MGIYYNSKGNCVLFLNKIWWINRLFNNLVI
jgi:hypothetical protein